MCKLLSLLFKKEPVGWWFLDFNLLYRCEEKELISRDLYSSEAFRAKFEVSPITAVCLKGAKAARKATLSRKEVEDGKQLPINLEKEVCLPALIQNIGSVVVFFCVKLKLPLSPILGI
ncbi:unnamed protein product [Clavelina lepadiformis]|uniref:Uncharacterized protein n=1 Tax=Clavelina lepadiformis TaxID=159417 RepID=A0ABP0FTB2_CLALP